jgi:hypothetical protein
MAINHNVLDFIRPLEEQINSFIKGIEKGKCHTVSNLIASYLHCHFSTDIIHAKNINHGWVAGKDIVLDFVIDGSNKILTPGMIDFEIMKSFETEHTFEYCPLLACSQAANVENPYEPKSMISFLESHFYEIDETVIKAGYYT